MRVRASDYLWAGVAVLASIGFGWILAKSVASWLGFTSARDIVLLLAAVILTVVGARWIVLGAWRRTAWGAPPGGVRQHREHRIANGDNVQ